MVVSTGAAQAARCSFADCPIADVKTLDRVFADFKHLVDLRLPVTAPKKKV